jgi:ABC-type uncharacterized transport system substrate-binding protein
MRRAPLLALLLAPAPALAHPHVFVDSRIELLMDGPLVTAVRLTWTYDEFFSLLLTEELGLDPDADAQLTEEERVLLAASIADWPADYEGDLVLTRDGAALPLGARRDHSVAWQEARVVETHTRPLEAPVDVSQAALTVENFDPYFYVAYTILPEVALTGATGCAATVIPADPVAAQAEVDATYGALDIAGAGPEVELPPVGHAFSDRVEVRCEG